MLACLFSNSTCTSCRPTRQSSIFAARWMSWTRRRCLAPSAPFRMRRHWLTSLSTSSPVRLQMSDSGYFKKLGDKVARIPIDQPTPALQDDAKVVAAAVQLGFVNRDPEPAETDIDIRQPLGPVVMLTMRAPV